MIELETSVLLNLGRLISAVLFFGTALFVIGYCYITRDWKAVGFSFPMLFNFIVYSLIYFEFTSSFSSGVIILFVHLGNVTVTSGIMIFLYHLIRQNKKIKNGN